MAKKEGKKEILPTVAVGKMVKTTFIICFIYHSL
jgi:hypothetical protein